MDTATLLDTLYEQLPLETVARHEVGHAVMAYQCGGSVPRIILGRTASGEHFGRASWIIPASIDKRLLVLSGGVLALYLHQRPSSFTFQEFCDWASTLDGRVMAISGAHDWMEILRLTDQPQGYGIEDFLHRAVRPYFDEAIGLLAKATDRLDGLTELVVAQPPGIGRRALKRFFAGRPRSRWAERLDRPRVLWAAHAERRERGSVDYSQVDKLVE
jgi:hypothetical protein